MSVGLMGFGRIGRNVFRLLADDPLSINAIVDIAEPEALVYLLKYDSIYGRFEHDVSLDGSTLVMNGHRIPIIQALEPGDVDWAEYGVESVVQATGRFRTREYCQRHLDSGAHRVILASAPIVPGDIPVLLTGVNDEIFTSETPIIAMGSNTSNAFAPLLEVIDQAFGIERCFMTTVHAFTNNQRLADVPTDGFRTSRAAAENIIPEDTNSPELITGVLPQFAGKLAGMSLNVPVENGSTVDSVCELATPTTVEEANKAVWEATSERYPGILGYTTDPIVSSDVRGSAYSGIYDSLATMVVDGSLLKTIVWFDNGWGYSCRIVEALRRVTGTEATS